MDPTPSVRIGAAMHELRHCFGADTGNWSFSCQQQDRRGGREGLNTFSAPSFKRREEINTTTKTIEKAAELINQNLMLISRKDGLGSCQLHPLVAMSFQSLKFHQQRKSLQSCEQTYNLSFQD